MSEEHLEVRTPRGIMRGMLHTPSYARPQSVVVIVHGYFSANRVGPARLHVLISRCLSIHGSAVLRADFLGVGDSDGDFSGISFCGQLDELDAICNFATSTFPDSPLVLLGHSMGANLVLRKALERTDVRRIVLLAPDLDKVGGIDHLFSQEQLAELAEHHSTMRKGLPISASFIDEIRSMDLLSLAPKLQIPMDVVQGDKDELYSLEGAQNLARAGICGSFHVISEGDHNFLWPPARNVLLELLPRLAVPES